MAEEEITMKLENIYKVNDNENTTYQDVWGAAKAGFWEKCIVLNGYIRKQKKLKNQLSEPLKELK